MFLLVNRFNPFPIHPQHTHRINQLVTKMSISSHEIHLNHAVFKVASLTKHLSNDEAEDKIYSEMQWLKKSDTGELVCVYISRQLEGVCWWKIGSHPRTNRYECPCWGAKYCLSPPKIERVCSTTFPNPVPERAVKKLGTHFLSQSNLATSLRKLRSFSIIIYYH